MSATTFVIQRIRAGASRPACANCGEEHVHLDRNGLCPDCAHPATPADREVHLATR